MNYQALWKLDTGAKGRQTWHFSAPAPFNTFTEKDWESAEGKRFLEEMVREFVFKNNNPNCNDAVYRNQKAQSANQQVANSNVYDSALKAVEYYASLQAESGHWPADYGGPLFLTPGLIIASYITETPFSAPQRALLKQYFINHQNEDGGWGLHIEGPSTMFGTVLQYVALRLIGMEATHPVAVKGRNWIQQHGGATQIPAWGKFYLSILGVYEWTGVNSLLPEMMLLPEGLPMHPSHYWNHARMVYLPMAYCYGHRFVMKPTALTEELRKELYTRTYTSIDWAKARNQCCETDLYYPQSKVLKALNSVLSVYERSPLKGLRKKALDYIADIIDAEDEHTNYINIGPVNQAINSICVWHRYGKDSVQFKKHVERWNDYLWVSEDGMKMNGYNGSQLWDTVFAAQAILEGGFEKQFPETVRKAYQFIDISQVQKEVRDHKKYFRHDSVGGWPFSTVDHGWPITDCSAEGMKTALQIHAAEVDGLKPTISRERLEKNVDLLLSFQNKNGGWASYELTRGPEWLELLNPSEIFGNIMIDYPYTECTSASIQGLFKFKKIYPDYKKTEIEQSIKRGIEFILTQQKADGSWYGSWAVCFTYGTWFAVEALTQALASNLMPESKQTITTALDKARQFLLAKQSGDGGWGEKFESCVVKEYVPAATSQVVNTSWVLLSLMAMGDADKQAVEKGIQFLQRKQLPNGEYAQEGISGVFNHNCAISYTTYRNCFPIWAMGRYLKKWGGVPTASQKPQAASAA